MEEGLLLPLLRLQGIVTRSGKERRPRTELAQGSQQAAVLLHSLEVERLLLLLPPPPLLLRLQGVVTLPRKKRRPRTEMAGRKRLVTHMVLLFLISRSQVPLTKLRMQLVVITRSLKGEALLLQRR
jgi:hypothetical protein